MKYIKKLLLAFTVALFATPVFANYIMIVPQGPGQGTAVWAEIIARHLSKYVGEPIDVRYIPGARDIPGFNKFADSLRFNNKVIMVSHGGNGVSFLLDKVRYNYSDYSSIGMMNLDIVLGKKLGKDEKTGVWRMAGGSGYEPDGMAVAMLLCGPQPGGSIDAYLKCWHKRVIWVNGVKGNEKRLGFMRGEFDITRESTAAWKKFYTNVKDNQLWFTHGIYDLQTKTQIPDPNFPGTQFEDVYKKLWGVAPSGELYNSYKMTRNWRDVIQKALWVNKGNPNTEKLRAALKAMLADKTAMAEITRVAGNYPWIVGADGDKVISQLKPLITEAALKGAVKWNQKAYGFPSIYKPELVYHGQ